VKTVILEPGGHELLNVRVIRTHSILNAERFTLELSFEEHSGVTGDVVQLRGLSTETLMLLCRCLNTEFWQRISAEFPFASVSAQGLAYTLHRHPVRQVAGEEFCCSYPASHAIHDVQTSARKEDPQN
jgi:hypothetical protein